MRNHLLDQIESFRVAVRNSNGVNHEQGLDMREAPLHFLRLIAFHSTMRRMMFRSCARSSASAGRSRKDPATARSSSWRRRKILLPDDCLELQQG